MTLNWNEPFARFGELYELAKHQPGDPSAVTLATVDARGKPSARVVLLKGFDPLGFVIFTNYDSQKGCELLAQKVAALCFYWPSIDRQVRVEGTAEQTPAAESDVYFASRPRGAQLGAWASSQSRPLDNPRSLHLHLAEVTARYEGKRVPRPPHWGGFRIVPERIEFWTAGENRLHDRLVYEKQERGWVTQALYP